MGDTLQELRKLLQLVDRYQKTISEAANILSEFPILFQQLVGVFRQDGHFSLIKGTKEAGTEQNYAHLSLLQQSKEFQNIQEKLEIMVKEETITDLGALFSQLESSFRLSKNDSSSGSSLLHPSSPSLSPSPSPSPSPSFSPSSFRPSPPLLKSPSSNHIRSGPRNTSPFRSRPLPSFSSPSPPPPSSPSFSPSPSPPSSGGSVGRSSARFSSSSFSSHTPSPTPASPPLSSNPNKKKKKTIELFNKKSTSSSPLLLLRASSDDDVCLSAPLPPCAVRPDSISPSSSQVKPIREGKKEEEGRRGVKENIARAPSPFKATQTLSLKNLKPRPFSARRQYSSELDKGEEKSPETFSSFAAIHQKKPVASEISLATLDEIINTLTHEDNVNLHLRSIFFLTYYRFSTANEVLKLLINRYRGEAESQSKIKHQVFSLVKFWLDERASDFFKNPETTKSLTKLLKAIKQDYGPGAEILEKNVKKEKKYVEEQKVLSPRGPVIDLQWDSFDEKEFARALTLHEFSLFSRILPSEMLDWGGGERENCPNISKMVHLSNDFSSWVTTMLVSQTRLQNRIQLLIKFISLAEQLLGLQNFSGLVTLVGALTTTAVWRMKKTWENLGPERDQLFQQMKQIVSHKGNYSNYRSYMKSCAPPVVPYIGTYLSTLTFIEDGNKDFQLGLINFNKSKLLAKEMGEVLFYQKTAFQLSCQFDFVSSLEKMKSEILTENEMLEYSKYAEPKDFEDTIANLLHQLKIEKGKKAQEK